MHGQQSSNNRADVNVQGGAYGTALPAASEGGHKKTMQPPIDKAVVVSVQGGYYGSDLQSASVGRQTEIMQCLIVKDIEVNAQGRHSP